MTRADKLRDTSNPVVVCIALALGVWLVFGQTLKHGFLNYDDNKYIYDNRVVVQGLTWKGVAAAFTEADLGLWTPMARLSHMVDWQLFGARPWGHHLSNVLLHSCNTILLFIVLKEMTGALWRSAFVAAVFGLHPLHVESVAWLSERKDTLSALFFFLCLLAYVKYVRRPFSWVRYCTIIVLFSLGLLAKPMLVTLPFVLLLLDYWPLARAGTGPFRPAVWWRLTYEKLPLFLLTGVSVYLVRFDPFSSSLSQGPFIHPAFSLRLSNAVVSYATYIWKMFYPVGLSVRYRFPVEGIPVSEVAFSLLVLVAISAAAYWARSSRPYLIIGWLWYLGMLFPVSQVVLIGSEARCDRYTYLPQIGLYICVAWGFTDLLRNWRYRRIVSGAMAALTLLAMGPMAYAQTSYWKNNVSLWRHAIASTPTDWVVHDNLAYALFDEEKRPEEALREYELALHDQPDRPELVDNLGALFAATGRLSEATRQFERSLALKDNNPEAHDYLGLVLAREGKLDEAIHEYELSLADKSDFAPAHSHLAMALARQGKTSEAIQSYERALELKPSLTTAHLNLGVLLAEQGKANEAIDHYTKAIELEPGSPDPYNNLAWLLSTCPSAAVRNGTRAVKLAEEANRLSGGRNAIVLGTLAAAYAESGDYGKAQEMVSRAIDLANSANNKDLVTQLTTRRELYVRHEPFLP